MAEKEATFVIKVLDKTHEGLEGIKRLQTSLNQFNEQAKKVAKMSQILQQNFSNIGSEFSKLTYKTPQLSGNIKMLGQANEKLKKYFSDIGAELVPVKKAISGTEYSFNGLTSSMNENVKLNYEIYNSLANPIEGLKAVQGAMTFTEQASKDFQTTLNSFAVSTGFVEKAIQQQLRVPLFSVREGMKQVGVTGSDLVNRIKTGGTVFTDYSNVTANLANKFDTFGKVMAMDRDLFTAFIKQGYKFSGTGARVATQVRLLTHGLHGFKMELLSVMFFGVQTGQLASSLLRPGMQLFEITDLISDTLAYMLVPTMQKDILPAVLKLHEHIMKLNDDQKRFIGQLIVFGYVTGPVIQYIAMLALTIGAVHKALAILPPIVSVVVVVSVVGWTTFNSMLEALSRGEYGRSFEELKRTAEERKKALKGLLPYEVKYADAMMDGQQTLEIYKQHVSKSDVALQGAGMTAEQAGLIFNEVNNTTQNLTSVVKKLATQQEYTNEVTQTMSSTFQDATSSINVSTDSISDLNEVTNTATKALDFVNTNTFDWKEGLDLLNKVADNTSDQVNDLNTKVSTNSKNTLTAVTKTGDFEKALNSVNDTLDTSISKVNEYADALKKIPPEVSTTIKQKIVTTTEGGEGGIVSRVIETVRRIFHMQYGGIVTKPIISVIGEAGPEAVIPLKKLESYGGKTINISLSPTYNITGVSSKEEIEDMIDEANARLIEDLKSMLR